MISLTKSNLANLGVFAQGQSHLEVPFFYIFFFIVLYTLSYWTFRKQTWYTGALQQMLIYF